MSTTTGTVPATSTPAPAASVPASRPWLRGALLLAVGTVKLWREGS